MYNRSDRKDPPLSAINYVAVPGTPLASELLGHEKGLYRVGYEKNQGA